MSVDIDRDQIWFRAQAVKSDRAAPNAYNFFHITPALDIVSFFVSMSEFLKGSSEILAFTLSPGLKQFEWNTGNLVRVLKYPKALADFFTAYDDLMVMFETLQSWCEDGFPAEPREIRRQIRYFVENEEIAGFDFDVGRYSDAELVELSRGLRGLYRRFAGSRGMAHYMLSMVLEDLDASGQRFDMVRNNASEAIVWKVSALDKIVSGYEPLDMDTLEAIARRIGRYPKSYGRRLARPFDAEEFRKAWEKCLQRSE